MNFIRDGAKVETFTTALRTALADKTIELPTYDDISQMFHIQPLEQYIEFYRLLSNDSCITLIVHIWIKQWSLQ